jgi:biopolymer transport protein ExbB/TolQ
MDCNLKPLGEQVVVITGASSGIGLATALAAATKGAQLVLTARSGNTLEELVQSIQASGSEAIHVVADVGHRRHVERIAEEAVRQAFENAGRIALHRLERYLNTLGTIASAAPLLGLFGTVIGMIEIFGSQAPTGASNPQQLAHGISIALYNTAFGLMIAIPALMFYRYFRGRVDEYQLSMELAAERLVPHLMRFVVRNTAAASTAPER